MIFKDERLTRGSCDFIVLKVSLGEKKKPRDRDKAGGKEKSSAAVTDDSTPGQTSPSLCARFCCLDFGPRNLALKSRVGFGDDQSSVFLLFLRLVFAFFWRGILVSL